MKIASNNAVHIFANDSGEFSGSQARIDIFDGGENNGISPNGEVQIVGGNTILGVGGAGLWPDARDRVFVNNQSSPLLSNITETDFIETTPVGVSDINVKDTLDLTGNNITNIDRTDASTSFANISALGTTTLPTCDTSVEGHIRYNGTAHYGCDGASWNQMY